MADVISKQAKRKACELFRAELINGPGAERDSVEACWKRAFARYIETTSDVAKRLRGGCGYCDDAGRWGELQSFILPDEPDPLADLRAVLKEMYGEMPPPGMDWGSALIDRVSKGLAKRGKALKIVEAGDE